MSSIEPENPYAAPQAETFAIETAGPIDVPAGFGGKFGLAFKLLFTNLPLVAAIVLTVWLPLNVMIEYVLAESANPDNPLPFTQLNNLVEAIFGPIVSGALVWFFSERLDGRSPTYGAAMRCGFGNWGRLFWARFVAGVFIGLGFIALVVPGIILAIRCALIEPIVVLEGQTGATCRLRSAALVRGRGWQIFLAGFLYLVMTGLVGFSLVMVAESYPDLDNVWVNVASDCLLDLVAAFITLLLLLYYVDARRREQAESACWAESAKPSPVDPEL
jgi:hypothetical protein